MLAKEIHYKYKSFACVSMLISKQFLIHYRIWTMAMTVTTKSTDKARACPICTKCWMHDSDVLSHSRQNQHQGNTTFQLALLSLLTLLSTILGTMHISSFCLYIRCSATSLVDLDVMLNAFVWCCRTSQSAIAVCTHTNINNTFNMHCWRRNSSNILS